jgi:P-loop containing dynein motor region D4
VQRKFNEESRIYKLDLVLFTDALQHLMRISRLLAMDRGSALLVGVGGSGKQSLSRLAAYIRGAYTFQITVTKTYNTTNLFEDIKALYKVAAVKGQPVVFIFTDSEVKDEGFLEYINQILMTGEARATAALCHLQLASCCSMCAQQPQAQREVSGGTSFTAAACAFLAHAAAGQELTHETSR